MVETPAPHGLCQSCDVPLLQQWGFHGTDLCGPCCTGEASTAGKVSWECNQLGMSVGVCAGAAELKAGEKPGECHLCGAAMRKSRKAELPA